MRGKIVLITGASSGIGLVTARELARLGAAVVMLCRDRERGADARIIIAKAATASAPELVIADLAAQASVRAAAAEIGRRFERIDVLVNNAGGVFNRREVTGEDIERTFATNHLGPFLLTNLLLDRIASGGRIVNVVFEVYPSRLDFANLQGERQYGFFSAYTRSKLENILFTFELAKRLSDRRISVNCLSPGPARTRFGDNMTGLAGLFPRFAKALFPSAEKAARTVIYVASSPEVEGVTGRFFLHGRIRRTKPVTHDSSVAAQLWRVSAELVGLPPDAVDGRDNRLLERAS
jgi:NAD(P)-dependent dehydrogenase (short-subunit alcohol dehydrogenase family)